MHSGFRYIAVISDALREDPWNGRTGFVHHAVMEDFPDLSGVYGCGVPVMGEASQRDFIAQCRLPQDEFFADAFTTAADLAARQRELQRTQEVKKILLLALPKVVEVSHHRIRFGANAAVRLDRHHEVGGPPVMQEEDALSQSP
jgi:hypothetical protein